MKNNFISGIIIGSLISSIIFAGSLFVFQQEKTLSDGEKIKMFYETETATNVSAHGLRKRIEQNDKSFILVDIRSKEEYDIGHIKGAVSIPAYTDKDNTGKVSRERILNAVKNLGTDKEVILYCYSHYCMSSRKIGSFLAENGVYVKHLTVGWNEWRYNWELWNYPHEKDRTQDFIEKNPFVETGNPDIKGCEIEGEFSC